MSSPGPADLPPPLPPGARRVPRPGADTAVATAAVVSLLALTERALAWIPLVPAEPLGMVAAVREVTDIIRVAELAGALARGAGLGEPAVNVATVTGMIAEQRLGEITAAGRAAGWLGSNHHPDAPGPAGDGEVIP